MEFVYTRKFLPPDGSFFILFASYIRSFVADLHRTLLYKGVFMYPVDKKRIAILPRLLYECIPMVFWSKWLKEDIMMVRKIITRD